MKFFIKGIIRRIKYFFLNTFHKDVQRYLSYFQHKDFEIVKVGNSYKIKFDNSLGYFKANYEPEFSYSYFTNHFTVRFQEMEIKTLINPCFELINEWRGYTLKKTPKLGEVVIDAGAATAFVTMLFAKKVGDSGKVYALEPDQKMFKILCYNLKINKITNVIPIKKGLYCETGFFSFDSKTLSLVRSSGSVMQTIQTIDLQSLVINENIDSKKVSIIKLDIEGAEVNVANQLGSFIQENKNAMAVIASYHQFENTTTATKINNIINKNFPQLTIENDYTIHPSTYIYNQSD